MNDRNLNCFSSSCAEGNHARTSGVDEEQEDEVFVPPYKSQYSLVLAVARERTKTT